MQISGLAINSSKVALLALKKQGNILNIQSFAEKELPEGTIIGGILKKPEVFIQTLESLKKEARPKKISSPYVIMTLPEELVYLTVKPFPNIDADQIREALEINLNEFVPGKPEDIFWGYQTIENKQNKEIILASVKQSVLKDYLTSITAAGFIPIAIEPSSLAALRAFNHLSNTMLVEIDRQSVMTAVYDQQAGRFSSGFLYDPEKFIGQIKKIANFYKARKRLDNIEILLSGSQASEELSQKLAQETGDKVLLAQSKMLFKNPNLKSPTLLGAALRGLVDQKDDKNLSLLPVGTAESYAEKRTLRFIGGFANLITITCILFMIIFYGFWGLLYYLNFTTDQQLANSAKAQVDPEITNIQEKLKNLEPKIVYMKEIMESIQPVTPKLQSIKDATPANVSLTNIAMTKDAKTISVVGNAQNRDALAVFKDNLTKSKSFEKVDIAATNVAEANINFTVNLSIKK